VPNKQNNFTKQTKSKPLYLYAGLILAVFLGGILNLIALRYIFDNATLKLNDLTSNQQIRQAIGYEIVSDIKTLESNYFHLPPFSGLNAQSIMTEKLYKIISHINHNLNILENGGTLKSVIPLNIELQDKMTTSLVYHSDPRERYCLPALQIRPALVILKERIVWLTEMLDKRRELTSPRDTEVYFKTIKLIKIHLKKTIPLFRRMEENANSLQYDSAYQLKEIQRVVKKRKHQYRILELSLALGIGIVVILLSLVVFRRMKIIITNERKADERFRETSRFLETVINSLAHPLCVIDINSHEIIMANSAACEDATNANAIYCYEYLRASKTPCEKDCPLTKVAKGSSTRIEQTRIKNGHEQYIVVYGYPIFDENQKVNQMVEYCIDVTEQKNAEKKRQELEESLAKAHRMDALGLMAGGVAHDLNNILMGITGFPDLILHDLPSDSDLRQPLEIIRDSGNRAAAVVADLLTVARGVAAPRKTVDLKHLVKQYMKSAECLFIKEKYPVVNINIHFCHEAANITCSPVHMQKVLMNLLLNAAESIKGSGTISISIETCQLSKSDADEKKLCKGDYIILSIADSGIGISEENQKHIFEPFYTKKIRTGSGTGLGLTVVWNTIQEHDGQVSVESDENGTRFDVFLPASDSPESIGEKDVTKQNEKGNGETILVVDDEDIQRVLASKIIEKLGYKSQTVTSGEEAVEYLSNNSVDLILLDMLMEPGIDGFETYKRVKRIHTDQKCIVVSGFSKTDRVRSTLKLGAGAFLRKPYGMNDLAKVLKQQLEG